FFDGFAVPDDFGDSKFESAIIPGDSWEVDFPEVNKTSVCTVGHLAHDLSVVANTGVVRIMSRS
ncbi:MAG: hypothetical protein LBC48_07450, partial [Dysgonamonadaceae bacterium]|nr:hypothetical protein [Dysgonamonadaceae bacterium]